jgi:hypothetical protein
MPPGPARQPSYSDSFFFMPEQAPQPLAVPVRNKYVKRCISFMIHIAFIGVFETIFFFAVVSKSEDSGIQSTIESYLSGTLSRCSSWPPNATAVISDILNALLNATHALANAEKAAEARLTYNNVLQVQAWIYVATILLFLSGSVAAAKYRNIRMNWKVIFADNVCMIAMLGTYEYFFFRTIIYNYKSLSTQELDGILIHELESRCALTTTTTY